MNISTILVLKAKRPYGMSKREISKDMTQLNSGGQQARLIDSKSKVMTQINTRIYMRFS